MGTCKRMVVVNMATYCKMNKVLSQVPGNVNGGMSVRRSGKRLSVRMRRGNAICDRESRMQWQLCAGHGETSKRKRCGCHAYDVAVNEKGGAKEKSIQEMPNLRDIRQAMVHVVRVAGYECCMLSDKPEPTDLHYSLGNQSGKYSDFDSDVCDVALESTLPEVEWLANFVDRPKDITNSSWMSFWRYQGIK